MPKGGLYGHRAQLAVVCAASFVVWAGFGAVLPYLPVFLREQAHASLFTVGVVAAAFYVGTFLFAAPFGRLSDIVGRKPMMVMGVCLYSLATALFVSTTNPYWFVVFRLLEGMGAAAVTPAGQAFIADITPDSERSQAYGWLTTAQFGGLVAGPALAWPLYELGGGSGPWAFYAVFIFGSVLSALSALSLLVVLREPTERRRMARARRAEGERRPPLRKLVTRPIGAFLIVAVTGHFAMGSWEVLWSIWLRELGASVQFIGVTWIAFSFPMLLAFLGGRLADRYSRFRLMFIGYGISAVAWIVYGVTRSLTLFVIFNVVEGMAIALSYPAKQGFLVQVAPKRWIGSITGLEQSAMQGAALVGTLVSPLLFGLISGYAIGLGGVLLLGGLAISAPTLRREWRRLKEEEGVLSFAETEAIAETSWEAQSVAGGREDPGGSAAMVEATVAGASTAAGKASPTAEAGVP
jgi:DHA1 family multidrug resistance protein-like MFS transporter